MRPWTLASLSLCAVLSAGCGRRSEPSQPPEPQTTQAAGPGADSCAAYVQRVASGVRCQEVDHTRCSCELVAADATGAGPGSPPLLDTGDGAGSGSTTGSSPQPQAGASATLVFPPGPPNTTVKCLSGPCPVTTAELVTAPYPPLAASAQGTVVELEFHAADHRPHVAKYTIFPGTNQVPFSLERIVVLPPDSAMITFQGAPEGATVQCVSGPCPDKKQYALDSFPAVKLARDDQTLLLRFNAPGYRTAMSSFQVSRGPNVIPVLMEKGTNGKTR